MSKKRIIEHQSEEQALANLNRLFDPNIPSEPEADAARHNIIVLTSEEQARANLNRLFDPNVPSEPEPEEQEAEAMEDAPEAGVDKLELAEDTQAGEGESQPVSWCADAIDASDRIFQIPIDLLVDFHTGVDKQPFHVYSAEKFADFREDISRNGVLQPLIVRPEKKTRQYEIIAGHNRRNAARSLGYKTVPSIIRLLSDDEAILQMISTNLAQREKLLPSEKAWAYRLRAEALNRQGFRSDLTCSQFDNRSLTAKKIGEEAGDSVAQVFRFIRLSYLVPELLAQVDAGTLGLMPGATLSYLNVANQKALAIYAFGKKRIHLSMALAEALRKADEEGTVFSADTLPLLTKIAFEKQKIGVSGKILQKYFTPGTSRKAINKTVDEALKLYFLKKEGVKNG